MSAFAVVNPRSGSGRTGQDWPEIERGLRALYPELAFGFTSRRGEASALTRRALGEGHTEIIAVGGDGTINEAVNGLFDKDGPLAPETVFAFVSSGTGGDFRKSFGIGEGPKPALERLRKSKLHRVDVGRVSCLSREGLPVTRYFVNLASFGLSGEVVAAVNRARFAKLLGGKFAFGFHSALALLRHRDRMVRLHVDTGFDEITPISTVAVANATTFGGGMKIAPGAKPDDGEFDIVVIGGASKWKMLRRMKQLYDGTHLSDPAIRLVRGRKLVAAPVAQTHGHAVPVETDGESAGILPASFEILPGALNLRC